MTNSKSTKRALVSSALSVLICVAMLIGTTFAWFTDTASTSVNKIQAGNLDVALEVKEGGKWVSAEEKVLDFVKAEGHEGEAILWEPGCNYKLPQLRIVNKGNLALKYKVVITGINGDAKLDEVIDWTIGDVAQGTEQHLAAGENAEFIISGTMNTEAGNEYKGLSIDGISITVYATQDTVEYDSNGNTYDGKATLDGIWDGKTTEDLEKDEEGVYHITSAAQFVGLMNATQNVNSAYAGEKIVLDCNIDFGGATIKGVGSEQCNFAGTFDGNGHTISNFVIDRSDKDIYAGLFNYVTVGTISNLIVANATINGDQSQVGALVGGLNDNAIVKDCSVVNCTVIANRKVGGAIGYVAGATVENVSVKDTTIYVENDTQYGKVVGYENTGAVVNNVNDENVTIIIAARVNTLDDFTAAVNNTQISKITLTGDITNETVPLNAGQNAYTYTLKARNLTIDLNGHTFNTPVRMFYIEEYKNTASTLTIMSSKQGGKINMNKTGGSEAYGFVVNKNCTLNIKENVTIDMNLPTRAQYQTLILNNGTVNMSGGKLVAYNTIIVASHYTAKNNGIFNMTGGEINLDASSTGIQTAGNNNPTINLTKGSITGKGVAYESLYGGVYNVSTDFVIADSCTITVKK